MGSTVKEQVSDGPNFDKFGVITGSTSVVLMVDEECDLVRFKADADNATEFLIGEAGSGLTPFALEAGDDTGWVVTSNLNRYEHSSPSGTYNYLQWWLQK